MTLPHRFKTHPRWSVADVCGAAVLRAQFRKRSGRLVLESFARGGPSSRGESGVSAITVPPHLALTKFIEVPAIAGAKLAKVIRFEASQQIPYPLDEVVWDYGVMGRLEGRLQIALSAAKTEEIESWCAALDGETASWQRAVPVGVALAHSFLQNYGDRSGATLVVYVGERATQLLFAGDGRWFLRTLTLAPDGAKETRDAFSRTLEPEIMRALHAMRRQIPPVEPSLILVAGDEESVCGLAEPLSERSGCVVEPFDALRAVDLSVDAEQAGARSHRARLAAAVIASNTAPVAPNLLPPAWKREHAARSRFPLLMASAAMISAAMIPPLVHFHGVAAKQRAEIARVDSALQPVRMLAMRNANHLAAIEALERQRADADNFARERTAWLGFMADLQQRLAAAEDVWLEKLAVIDAAPDGGGRVGSDNSSPLRLTISGRIINRDGTSGTPFTAREKVKRLLATLRESGFVGSIEGERFDGTDSTLLRFDLTIVAANDSRL